MAQIITFIIFGGFGLVLAYVGVTQFFQQRRLLANAERVDVVIVHSQVFSSTSSDTDQRMNRSNSTVTHRPDVRFRYQAQGKEFESDLLYPNIIVHGFISSEAAAEVLTPYPLGATVRAYLDPSAPDKAFLIAESGKGPLVFMIVGLLLVPISWLVGRYI